MNVYIWVFVTHWFRGLHKVCKPDKRLKWLPHLGTVQLEIQLEDRTLEVDVAPLEAAFIKLFSQKRNLFYLESHRTTSLKALSTWVDHGVLSDVPEFTFNLPGQSRNGRFLLLRESETLQDWVGLSLVHLALDVVFVVCQLRL
ncbi:hypothetical protein M413DRAFT_72370 [Hebeloma cylindrosporum]|uniref:Uncharacterized protein n=1 Tax=Hebeloma cylindrosporum TaxID=76867 RepID=A0A0C3BX71_HEBCY|nr:hypothetical protein M413DRAFT_72370 [Hebeloma cylindrosporum h7]